MADKLGIDSQFGSRSEVTSICRHERYGSRSWAAGRSGGPAQGKTFRTNKGTINAQNGAVGAALKSAVVMKMMQVASLQETISKGRRHYYNGITLRNWKLTMLNMYGGDTRPFLDDAWNAVVEEAESRARESSKRIANSKRLRPGIHSPAGPGGPINFFGQLTMLALNAMACVMLLGACLSRLPFPYTLRLPWICFAAFTFTAVWRVKDGAAFICLPLACLFNPFFPVHLSRGLWSLLDGLSFLLLLALSVNFVANPKR
jgi:hypothetical protein